MNHNNYLWLLPFVSFFGGYYFVHLHSHTDLVATPLLVGSTTHDALAILSPLQLYPRLLTHKIDPDLPEGIIINQKPSAGKKIKRGQSVLLVITKQPKKIITPTCIKSYAQTVLPALEQQAIRTKTYYVQSPFPADYCVGQHPTSGTTLRNNRMILYLSSPEKKPVIVPSLYKKSVAEVQELLNCYDLSYELVHKYAQPAHHTCDQCIITDQRPLAGSIVTIANDKKPVFRLHVEPNNAQQ